MSTHTEHSEHRPFTLHFWWLFNILLILINTGHARQHMAMADADNQVTFLNDQYGRVRGYDQLPPDYAVQSPDGSVDVLMQNYNQPFKYMHPVEITGGSRAFANAYNASRALWGNVGIFMTSLITSAVPVGSALNVLKLGRIGKLGAARGGKGLMTPNKFFGSVSQKQAQKLLTKKYGQPVFQNQFKKSFYNPRTRRSFTPPQSLSQRTLSKRNAN